MQGKGRTKRVHHGRGSRVQAENNRGTTGHNTTVHMNIFTSDVRESHKPLEVWGCESSRWWHSSARCTIPLATWLGFAQNFYRQVVYMFYICLGISELFHRRKTASAFNKGYGSQVTSSTSRAITFLYIWSVQDLGMHLGGFQGTHPVEGAHYLQHNIVGIQRTLNGTQTTASRHASASATLCATGATACSRPLGAMCGNSGIHQLHREGAQR